MVAQRIEYDKPEMDKSSEIYGSMDLGAGLLFNPGAKDYNAQLRDITKKLENQNADLAWESYSDANRVADENQGDWEDYGKYLFGDDGHKMEDFYAGLQGREGAATGAFKDAMGNWVNPADLFSDPDFLSYVGDSENSAFRSPEAKGALSDALRQTKELTSVKETAQEKLMREMARRTMEQNMRGSREAQMSNLRERGVYGSGAETVGNMMAMQEQAQRRSLENMQANAGAQQRAMAALGQFGNLAGTMGSQDLEEGQLANQNSQFNKNMAQQSKNFRASQKIGAINTGNAEGGKRASSIYNAALGETGRERDDYGKVTGARGDFTKGGIETRSGGQQLRAGANQAIRDVTGAEIDRLKEDEMDEGWLG